MSQKVRVKKKRSKVKGIAIKKNKSSDTRLVTKTYGGGVSVTTYKKEGKNDNRNKKTD